VTNARHSRQRRALHDDVPVCVFCFELMPGRVVDPSQVVVVFREGGNDPAGVAHRSCSVLASLVIEASFVWNRPGYSERWKEWLSRPDVGS
jgi:hypothetical protein